MKRALFLLLPLLVGCAGARTAIIAPNATYPVSLSEGMRAADGHVLDKSEMKVVATFHEERTAWGMFYSAIRFTPRTDLSDAVNKQVADAKGEGIVRLRVESKACWLDYAIFLTLLPVWPGCAKLTIDGEIIKQQAGGKSVPNKPAAKPASDKPAAKPPSDKPAAKPADAPAKASPKPAPKGK